MPTQYLIAISIIGWGVGAIFYKIANNTIHPIMVSTIVTATFVALTPLAYLTMNIDKTITTSGVLATIAGGVLMGIGSISYYYALGKGDAGVITATTALYPALTLIISCSLLGEEMTIRKAIGIVLACASFYFLSWK